MDVPLVQCQERRTCDVHHRCRRVQEEVGMTLRPSGYAGHGDPRSQVCKWLGSGAAHMSSWLDSLYLMRAVQPAVKWSV